VAGGCFSVSLPSTVATLVLVFRNNQDLLNERFKLPVQEGQPLADKILVVLVLVFLLWRDSAHSVRCVPISLVCLSDRISVGFIAISGWIIIAIV